MRSVLGVFTVALVAVVVGCGDDSSTTGAAPPDGPISAADKAQAEQLLEETFGPNAAASSGQINGSLDIEVTGVRRYSRPISLTFSGPFNQGSGGTAEANLSAGIDQQDTIFGGEMILVDDEVLIGLGSTVYETPRSIAEPIRRPLSNTDNALAAVLDVFSLRPREWARNPRVIGEDEVGGIDVIRGTADIDPATLFADAARFTRLLTSLRLTEITGLPEMITPRARAALARSVTSASGEVLTGAQDKVMRRALLTMLIEPSAADRKVLGGLRSIKVRGTVDVTEVGSDPKITQPAKRGSYAQLQLSLDALGESAKRDLARRR